MGETDLVKQTCSYKRWWMPQESALVRWEQVGMEPTLIWEDFSEELTFDLRFDGWVSVN